MSEHSEHSIMLDTMHNKFNGSSFQFEIDTAPVKKICRTNVVDTFLRNIFFIQSS